MVSVGKGVHQGSTGNDKAMLSFVVKVVKVQSGACDSSGRRQSVGGRRGGRVGRDGWDRG